MAARALSSLLASGHTVVQQVAFYSFALETLNLTHEEARDACIELALSGVPMAVLNPPCTVIEATAAHALLEAPKKYLYFCNMCASDAERKILALAASKAFRSNNFEGLNRACAKIDQLTQPWLVYQDALHQIEEWLMSEPRCLPFYARTQVLFTRFKAKGTMSKDTRKAFFLATVRGGCFRSMADAEEARLRMEAPECTPNELVAAICQSGKAKVLNECLLKHGKKAEELRELLGPQYEGAITQASISGRKGVLRMLLGAETEAQNVYKGAIGAVQCEHTGVIEVILQWARTQRIDSVEEVVAGIGALVNSMGGPAPTATPEGRVRGMLDVLNTGMEKHQFNGKESGPLSDQAAWDRVLAGTHAMWAWDESCVVSTMWREFFSVLCGRELRAGLCSALRVTTLPPKAVESLVACLPFRSHTSLLMIEDLCTAAKCAHVDADPETALRALCCGSSSGIVQGTMRLVRCVRPEDATALANTYVETRNAIAMQVMLILVPEIVSPILQLQEEKEHMRIQSQQADKFTLWMTQRTPGQTWCAQWMHQEERE